MSDVALLKRIIQIHYTEIHCIKDVARFTTYSAETIRRDFTRSEHVSLSKYITEIRVEMAKRLLETTEKSCQEICDGVGFSRADVGARTFKRITGRTMKEFRNYTSCKDYTGAGSYFTKIPHTFIPPESTGRVNR